MSADAGLGSPPMRVGVSPRGGSSDGAGAKGEPELAARAALGVAAGGAALRTAAGGDEGAGTRIGILASGAGGGGAAPKPGNSVCVRRGCAGAGGSTGPPFAAGKPSVVG